MWNEVIEATIIGLCSQSPHFNYDFNQIGTDSFPTKLGEESARNLLAEGAATNNLL